MEESHTNFLGFLGFLFGVGHDEALSARRVMGNVWLGRGVEY